MIPFLGPADPFPPVEQALDQPDGLLAAGGSLTTRRLVDAYRRGIFPWFNEGDPILWWSPDPRTVLRPSRLHVSHSLRKKLRKASFLVTIDRAFARVLDGCAAPRAGDSGTWLSLPMRRAYTSLARGGPRAFDRSVDGRRAGRRHLRRRRSAACSSASRCSRAAPTRRRSRWRGWPRSSSAGSFPLIDCQLETDHLLSLGAEHMSRRAFVAEVERLTELAGPKWAIDADLAGSRSMRRGRCGSGRRSSRSRSRL